MGEMTGKTNGEKRNGLPADFGPDLAAFAKVTYRARNNIGKLLGSDDPDADIARAWEKACSAGAVRVSDGGRKATFTVGYLDGGGSAAVAMLCKSDREGDEKPWFIPDVYRRERDRLKEFGSIPFRCWGELAELAMPEPWDFEDGDGEGHPILRSYLSIAFARALDAGRVLPSRDGTQAVFDTGLSTRSYDAVYGVFKKDPTGNFVLRGFCAANQGHLGKHLVSEFAALPRPLARIACTEDAVFDPDAPIGIDFDHIIGSRLHRLPYAFLASALGTYPGATAAMAAIGDGGPRPGKVAYSSLGAVLKSDPSAWECLRTHIEAAVESSRRRSRWDLSVVIPGYNPQNEGVCFLLPLFVGNEGAAGAAILLTRLPDGGYQGQTVLTLGQAYRTARNAGRISAPWLLSATGAAPALENVQSGIPTAQGNAVQDDPAAASAADPAEGNPAAAIPVDDSGLDVLVSQLDELTAAWLPGRAPVPPADPDHVPSSDGDQVPHIELSTGTMQPLPQQPYGAGHAYLEGDGGYADVWPGITIGYPRDPFKGKPGIQLQGSCFSHASHEHGKFDFYGGGWYYRDKSRNGTRITRAGSSYKLGRGQAMRLKDGDTISFAGAPGIRFGSS